VVVDQVPVVLASPANSSRSTYGRTHPVAAVSIAAHRPRTPPWARTRHGAGRANVIRLVCAISRRFPPPLCGMAAIRPRRVRLAVNCGTGAMRVGCRPYGIWSRFRRRAVCPANATMPPNRCPDWPVRIGSSVPAVARGELLEQATMFRVNRTKRRAGVARYLTRRDVRHTFMDGDIRTGSLP
jgi:hypothetical protein